MLLWLGPLPFGSNFQKLLAADMANMRMSAAIGRLVLPTLFIFFTYVDRGRVTRRKGALSIGVGTTIPSNATPVVLDGPMIEV